MAARAILTKLSVQDQTRQSAFTAGADPGSRDRHRKRRRFHGLGRQRQRHGLPADHSTGAADGGGLCADPAVPHINCAQSPPQTAAENPAIARRDCQPCEINGTIAMPSQQADCLKRATFWIEAPSPIEAINDAGKVSSRDACMKERFDPWFLLNDESLYHGFQCIQKRSQSGLSGHLHSKKPLC